MKDYLIVGCGLAGIAFAETALQHGKSVMVVDGGPKASSIVAGGLYNPVVLKRLTAIWKAIEVTAAVKPFYAAIESKLGVQVDYPYPVLRRFFSIEEQNNWFAASDKPVLSELLHPVIRTFSFGGLTAPFGYGEVLQTGYVDAATLVSIYREWLDKQDCFRQQELNYGEIQVHEDHITYGDLKARHLICCDGFAMHDNPFFSYLPLDGTKGELLVIKADQLELSGYIVNGGVFIVPIGGGLFKVGATYNPVDKTLEQTASGKADLMDKLSEIVNCPFEVVQHLVGIRPTVKDRRALIGKHPEHANVHIMNGLGSRGVMLAPYLSKQLYNAIENGEAIDPEVDIKRYEKKYYRGVGPS